MVESTKTTIATAVAVICGGIMTIVIAPQHPARNSAVAFVQGANAGAFGGLIGYILARIVLAFFPTTAKCDKKGTYREK
jgi:hypothetical protein